MYMQPSRCHTGSPPPTRGTLDVKNDEYFIDRITPAYAGNTLTSKRLTVILKDHPRLRGEHPQGEFPMERNKGSPPPTRGTLVHSHPPPNFQRITPAYAGNTYSRPICLRYGRDHPRLRGEHYSASSYSEKAGGSPPPTRGTRYRNE